jgi:hypothetical protein
MKTVDSFTNAMVTQDFPLSVTATAAAGSAVTLTIPAPPLGQRAFINHIVISRFAAALLVAAAVPNIVTTTNLNGNPAWDFQADAAAQGLIDRLILQGGTPWSSSVVTTSVTIVCPATTNVIWRVTAFYSYGTN